jgi:hypothetical protein
MAWALPAADCETGRCHVQGICQMHPVIMWMQMLQLGTTAESCSCVCIVMCCHVSVNGILT